MTKGAHFIKPLWNMAESKKWVLLFSHKMKEGVTKTGSARKRKWLKTNHPQREDQEEIKIKLSGK